MHRLPRRRRSAARGRGASAAAAAEPPTAAEAMPATRPEVLPPISVGAWTRVGGIFQSATDPSQVNDWRMDNAYVELHAGGKIHQKVSVTLNLNANMVELRSWQRRSAPRQPLVEVMDAIISFDPIDEFHLWAGRLLVPVDRANASGPFFMIPWNYPGFLTVGATTLVTAPLEGPYGRNNGAVIWGDIKGGRLTYLAGVFDNANVATSPLCSGRVRLALLDLGARVLGQRQLLRREEPLLHRAGRAVPEERQLDHDGPEGLGRGQPRHPVREEARRRLLRDRRGAPTTTTTSTTAA